MTSLTHPPLPDLATLYAPRHPAAAHLLDETTLERYRGLLVAGTERVAARIRSAAGPVTGTDAGALVARAAGVDLDRPLPDTAAALDELDELYLRDAVYFHHPRYLGHLNCPVVIPALVAEAMLSAVNSSLDTVDQSVGATVIEQRLIRWTGDRIGFGAAADGVFTSGGTQSNLQALFVARQRARELHPGAELVVLVSEVGHFSVDTAARLLGLGPDAVRRIACTADRRMRPDALADALRRCAEVGEQVMAVVATAGTTDFGSIDPLPEVAELAAAAGTWLHVDAAYGCGLLVSSRRRHLMTGLQLADSVTVDFHKSFFQPVSASAVLFADGAALRHVTHHADYLNPALDAGRRVRNQVDKSLQTTRRFDALKLWLTLRVMGADAIGELFDAVVDRAAQVYELLSADPRFEVVTAPTLSTLVFRPVLPRGTDPELANAVVRHAREALFTSGAAVVAGTVIDGRAHLKFTVLNPRTTLDDAAEVLDLLAGHAAAYLAARPTAQRMR